MLQKQQKVNSFQKKFSCFFEKMRKQGKKKAGRFLLGHTKTYLFAK